MTGPHSCSPPQEDLPPAGGTWTCPTCGRRWRLDDVADDAARGGPSQRLMWSFDGGPPPVPKHEPERMHQVGRATEPGA